MSGRSLLLPLLCVLGVGCQPAPPRGVVLVVVDTLRADRLGVYGAGRPTSPRPDAFARRAALFEHAYATSGWTVPSFGSLSTGQLPARHGAGRVEREGGEIVLRGGRKQFHGLDTSVTTLAERLRGEGFATGAFVSNPFLGRDLGLDRRFDHYVRLPGGTPAARIVARATAWLEREEPRRFLLLVHCFDPHLPYNARGPARGRFTGPLSGQLPVKNLAERPA